MLELWQTEWCPASRRIRERLTELGIDYVTRQVPVGKAERTALRQKTGSDTIPALVLEDGQIAWPEGRAGKHAVRTPLRWKRRQIGELATVVGSRAGSTFLAEAYTGWPTSG